MKLTKKDLERLHKDLIQWIRERMDHIGAGQVVLGISGGKDSTVAAALCRDALGPDKVHGLLMPKGVDKNLGDGMQICEDLGIKSHIIDIGPIFDKFAENINDTGESLSDQARINLPPRIRMVMMYAYAQSIESAVVINTSNLSEDYIGYVTIYGDSAGAFAPLGGMTSDEIVQLGLYMGLRKDLVLKTPEDGLTAKTDEEVFGFSYEVLNTYIRTGQIENLQIKEKIDRMNRGSRFKFKPIPVFQPDYIKSI